LDDGNHFACHIIVIFIFNTFHFSIKSIKEKSSDLLRTSGCKHKKFMSMHCVTLTVCAVHNIY
jgi:hypothetical protein